jgi:hypothetical protein
LVRSARFAAAGASLLCVSIVAILVALPRFTPLELLHCIPAAQPQEGTVCFSSVNPLYPIVFLLSVAGTIILFFGAFGSAFVVSPVFVAGIIALEYGLSGVVSAVLDTERGTPIDPDIFVPLVAIGALAIGFQTYRRLRRRPAS